MSVDTVVGPAGATARSDRKSHLRLLPPPGKQLVGGAATGAVGGLFGIPSFLRAFVVVGLTLLAVRALQERAEDLADLEAARLARAEAEADPGGTIPWEQLKAELGL